MRFLGYLIRVGELSCDLAVHFLSFNSILGIDLRIEIKNKLNRFSSCHERLYIRYAEKNLSCT